MARDSRAFRRANKNIQNIASTLNNNMDALYRNTYMTDPQQNKDLEDLNSRINANIDKIVSKNMDTHGMPSVTQLYSRISNTPGGKSLENELSNMFNNGIVSDDLYGMFMSNRYLKELDNEIDTVCRYMPKLEEALAVQKDCILSADHFSKDFLNLEYPAAGEDAKAFAERAKDLKFKYELAKKVEEIYEDTSKYGEKFVYRVPASIAIGRLLATKPDAVLVPPSTGVGMRESSIEDNLDNLTENFMISVGNKGFKLMGEGNTAVVTESVINKGMPSENKKEVINPTDFMRNMADTETFNIGLQLCKSGILESAVREYQLAMKKKTTYSEQSLASLFEAGLEAKGNISFAKNKKDGRIITNDGLITGQPSDEDMVKVKAPGCIVKFCPREQVLPIYIDDICMGYYYFELRSTDDSESFMGFKNILGDPLTNMRGDRRNTFNSVDTTRQDETIKYVAGQLSKFIDKSFVNNNQDLAKEIYMILKYNDLFNTPSIDLIRVTFIPPEDMVHFFFKQDPITHRGISDLEKGLIPAKIYSSLYITSALATLTRGQDKRVYYVKQTVDTNIAQTLLNTIAQIKQSNFGIRQFQNINNILNITGRFNDMVIPTNASGDPPIQFEIMPGQDIKVPTELMESLEEMAINSTNIPKDIISSRQSVDYAIQITMSSSKVLRFCYKRQELFENLLTQLISPIYNYEYDENVQIEVKLPPPGFINITNTNQLIDNTKAFVQNIVDIDMAAEGTEDELLKNVYFDKLFKHYLGTHLDVASHEQILKRARIEAKQKQDESHASGSEDSDY